MYQIRKFLLLSLLIMWHGCYALETDKHEKLNIVSDAGSYNFKTGVDIYEGHVKVDQGTTHLIADKLITKKNKAHQIEEAIAYGLHDLAHFWTLSKINDPEIHAYAKIIKFYPLQSNATLVHEVLVKQGDNRFQGQLIHYNSSEQTITVPATPNAHASVIYYPEK